MLARSDILVCLLPLTAATRGILNASLFAKLPRDGRLGGPILLNAGRGGLQVEADILAALDSGALKGASLDVFEIEPLPQDSPLWRHPAVFVTPHNAALSHPDSVARAIAEQILAHERGEPLRNVVDRGGGTEASLSRLRERVGVRASRCGFPSSGRLRRPPSPAGGRRGRLSRPAHFAMRARKSATVALNSS